MLVVVQLSMSIVLLSACGLMLRTLDRLNNTDLGFTPERILTAQVAPRTNPEAFFASLVERVQQLPGVIGAGATSGAPMTSGNTSLNVYPVGTSLIASTTSVQSDWRSISAGYFGAMQIAMIAGRDFTPHDDDDAPKVVVVNETLARGLWGNDSPIGHQLDLGGGGGEPATIIGLVRDVRSQNPADAARPTYYVSAYRGVWGPMTLAIRTAANAEALLPLVRSEVRALDPTLPVFGVRTMTDLVGGTTCASTPRGRSPRRICAAGAAAGGRRDLRRDGVLDTPAYPGSGHSHRTRGATSGCADGAGSRRGLVGGGWRRDRTAHRAASHPPDARLLTGVSPFDPLTFLVATLLLVVCALVACTSPRAARRVSSGFARSEVCEPLLMLKAAVTRL